MIHKNMQDSVDFLVSFSVNAVPTFFGDLPGNPLCQRNRQKYGWLHPSSRISILTPSLPPFPSISRESWSIALFGLAVAFLRCWVHQIFCWQANTLLIQNVFVCVRVRRSGQPRNGLKDCRWSDMCCLRGNKNWGLLRWSEVFHTMVLPQESGQLPVSRLGDAIRSAGMNLTASEVGNSVPFSFHLLRMDKTQSCDIFFGPEKLKRYWSSNRSLSHGCGIFSVCKCMLDHFLCVCSSLPPPAVNPGGEFLHLWNLNLLKSWKVSQMLPATEAGLTLERFQQLMQVRIEG